MTLDYADLVGYFGALCISLLYIPQLFEQYNTYKNPTSQQNIPSLMFIVLAILTSISFLTYGILRLLYPVIVSNFIALIVNILTFLLRYLQKQEKKNQHGAHDSES